MYILKNAWISIIRNKSRNILIGSIILVIACCCTITLAINNTANDLINSYDSAYKKELTISFDRESMRGEMSFSKNNMDNMKEKFNNVNSYSIDDVKKFAESDHIESYYYTYSIGLNGNSIDKAEMKLEENEEMPNMGGFRGKGNRGEMMSSTDFTLTGYSSIDAMSEFIEGKYTMTDISDDAWEVAFNGNNIFINEELADYNELEVGDTIKLEDEDGTNTYKFTIIGIFSEESSEDDNQSMMSMFSNSANTIITNSDCLVEITNENDTISGSVSPTFIIDDYENAEKVQEEFYEKGLDENYVVQTNQELAEAGLSSIKNVKSFASTFLIISLLIGAIVLFVLNMINIRERKYEIGVLRTIGMSKFKLTSQFVCELLIVALVALSLGAGVGAICSKSVSNSLLSSEIESSKASQEEMQSNFGGPGDRGNGQRPGNMPEFNKMNGVINVQAYDSIDAVVNITVILELLGIGILLVLVSSLASMISIQRFSPLTILKERS